MTENRDLVLVYVGFMVCMTVAYFNWYIIPCDQSSYNANDKAIMDIGAFKKSGDKIPGTGYSRRNIWPCKKDKDGNWTKRWFRSKEYEPHNRCPTDQSAFDNWSFTHLNHGAMLWAGIPWLLGITAKYVSKKYIFLIAVLLEQLWEIKENSRGKGTDGWYHYIGDARINSVGDVVAATTGAFLSLITMDIWPYMPLAWIVLWELCAWIWGRNSLLIEVLNTVWPNNPVTKWHDKYKLTHGQTGKCNESTCWSCEKSNAMWKNAPIVKEKYPDMYGKDITGEDWASYYKQIDAKFQPGETDPNKMNYSTKNVRSFT